MNRLVAYEAAREGNRNKFPTVYLGMVMPTTSWRGRKDVFAQGRTPSSQGAALQGKGAASSAPTPDRQCTMFRLPAGTGPLQGHQPVPDGISRRLGPVGGIGLIEDAGHMMCHGPEANNQLIGYLPVALPKGDEA